MDNMAPIVTPVMTSNSERINMLVTIKSCRQLSNILMRPVQVDITMLVPMATSWMQKMVWKTGDAEKAKIALFRLLEMHVQFALIQQAVIARLKGDNLIREGDWTAQHLWEEGNHPMWDQVATNEFNSIHKMKAYLEELFKEIVKYSAKIDQNRRTNIISYEECLLAITIIYPSARQQLWPRMLITGHRNFNQVVNSIPATFSNITAYSALEKMKNYDLGYSEYLHMKDRTMEYHEDIISLAQECRNSFMPNESGNRERRRQALLESTSLRDYIPEDRDQQYDDPTDGKSRSKRGTKLPSPKLSPEGKYGYHQKQLEKSEPEEMDRQRKGMNKSRAPEVQTSLSAIFLEGGREEDGRQQASGSYLDDRDRLVDEWLVEDQEIQKAKERFQEVLETSERGYRYILNNLQYSPGKKTQNMVEVHNTARQRIERLKDYRMNSEMEKLYEQQETILDEGLQKYIGKVADEALNRKQSRKTKRISDLEEEE